MFGLAQADWELKKDDKGIQVFVKNQTSSDFKAFKAQTKLSCEKDVILDILKRVEGYPDLFPDTEDSRLIKIEKNGDIIHYSRTKAPWPVSDRDGTYRSHFSSEGNTTKVRLETVSGLVDEKEGVVRILDSEAIWTLKELGNKQIELVYEVYANPNGSIPAWLVNSAAVSLPFETLVNMKDLVLERSE